MGNKVLLFKRIVRSSVWLLRYFLIFRIILYRKHRVTKLKIFKFLSWHGGASYFVGVYKKEKVFIKTDSFALGILKNEYFAYEKLSESIAKNHLAKVYICSAFSNNDFIITEFVRGSSILNYSIPSVDCSAQLFKDINNQFKEIISAFHENSMVHRDLRPDNIFIVKINNKYLVRIIDFSFCISTSGENSFIEVDFIPDKRKLWATLGEGYKPEYYSWDDAFAVNMVFEDLLKKYDFDSEINSLGNMVGKVTYSIDGK